MALPQLTERLDDTFLSTWYDIKEEAIDNILNATVITAALKALGCFKIQNGGRMITRTIRYGTQTASGVFKGDTLSSGEPELETMAYWFWKRLATHVQRDAFTDQENAGPDKIKDYVGTRITAARDALEQKYETDVLGAFNTSETTGRLIQNLNDLIPSNANKSTGTYGGIARPTAFADSGNGVYRPSAGNTWWGGNYLAGTLASVATDLLDDMRTLYNSVGNNQSYPNLMVMTQTLFEIYESFAIDISQIVKDNTTKLADLGFEVLRFKGKSVIWTPNVDANTVMMLNTDFIDFVYDPAMWFDMTGWKPEALSTMRIAHILCAGNIVGDQPRRHGRLLYS